MRRTGVRCGPSLSHRRCVALCASVVFVLAVASAVHAEPDNTTQDIPRQLGTSSEQQWLYASSAPSLYQRYDVAPRLHFAVMCLPLWGHFQALHPVAEELAHRGHHVTYFVEDPHWCSIVLVGGKKGQGNWNVNCVVVNATVHGDARPLLTRGLFARISRYSSFLRGFDDLLNELFAHHATTLAPYLDAVAAAHAAEPFTTFLCDLTTFVCGSAARFLDVPAVHIFPFTLQLSLGFHTELPAMGTGLPRALTTWQRSRNFAIKMLTFGLNALAVAKLNRQRDRFGIPAYRDAFDVAGLYDTIIVPGLWGLDIAQPLCPNVHPVGGLLTRADRIASPLDLADDGLLGFLDRCEQGVIYVNFGTLALLSEDMTLKLERALRDMPFCVVWKQPAPADTQTVRPVSSDSQFFVRSWFSVPIGIMRHPNVFVFVSHCGDASVMEAIDAGLPILGLPIFADQGDVCQRISEAGVGVCLSGKYSFTTAEVTEAVWRIVSHTGDFTANLKKLQVVSRALGGPARAADIVETRQYNLFLRRGSSMEVCGALAGGVWRATGMSFRSLFLFLLVLLWWAFLLTARRAWTRISVAATLSKKWIAKLWRNPFTAEKPRGARMRIVPRRSWHDETKVE